MKNTKIVHCLQHCEITEKCQLLKRNEGNGLIDRSLISIPEQVKIYETFYAQKQSTFEYIEENHVFH